MPDENKYVLKADHIADISKLTGRIKDVDSKHMQLHSDLKLTINTLSISTQALTETSKKTNNILESIDEKMDGYNDRIKDVEYNVETTTKRVDEIEHSVSERKKGNAQLWGTIIVTIGGVIGSSLAFAQVFF
ncbi:hemolysin XhlA family protein [Mammaliicoccus sciuri]|uniref:hemolysin XhlA family protein n=1 Tax=Mammaliicoccus sciuri TaxID=1296 RepID=UPI001FB3E7FE|nr:hemolysin XhlA family protein [Mammaliicoccus sciuri]MCJ1783075.1 hemolysin XhlA family protein [Mammaliicoccus sciuri]